MLRKLLFALAVTLLLPVGALVSVVATAFLLAMTALFSPLILLGGCIKAAGYLSNKIFSMYEPKSPYKNTDIDNRDKKWSGGAYLLLNTLLIPLVAAPVLVAEILIASLVVILLLPVLTVWVPYTLVDKLKLTEQGLPPSISANDAPLLDDVGTHDEGFSSTTESDYDPSINSAPLAFFDRFNREILKRTPAVKPEENIDSNYQP